MDNNIPNNLNGQNEASAALTSARFPVRMAFRRASCVVMRLLVNAVEML